MSGDLDKELDNLERTLGDFEKAAKEALGFVKTIKYRDVSFDVSRRFVIADLSPLAFFHLVEHIGDDGVEKAVERLYERLMPLLTCRHEWTVLRRMSDEHLRKLTQGMGGGGSEPYLCKACTAYAFGGAPAKLPVVGRLVAG